MGVHLPAKRKSQVGPAYRAELQGDPYRFRVICVDEGGPADHHKTKRRVTFRASGWVAFGLTNTPHPGPTGRPLLAQPVNTRGYRVRKREENGQTAA